MLLNILLALLIVVGVGLTGLVLLQRSEGGALGMGGGGGQLVSARGAANFLTRTTWILGISFFVLSLGITILLGREAGTDTITDQIKIQAADPAKVAADREASMKQAADEMAAKQAARGGFTAPAPSLGLNPTLPAPSAPSSSPFTAPPPLAPPIQKAAPAAAPKAAPKAAAPAPAAPPPLPIIPSPAQ